MGKLDLDYLLLRTDAKLNSRPLAFKSNGDAILTRTGSSPIDSRLAEFELDAAAFELAPPDHSTHHFGREEEGHDVRMFGATRGSMPETRELKYGRDNATAVEKLVGGAGSAFNAYWFVQAFFSNELILTSSSSSGHVDGVVAATWPDVHPVMKNLVDGRGNPIRKYGCHTTFCLNSRTPPVDPSHLAQPVSLRAHVDVKNMSQGVCAVMAMGKLFFSLSLIQFSNSRTATAGIEFLFGFSFC